MILMFKVATVPGGMRTRSLEVVNCGNVLYLKGWAFSILHCLEYVTLGGAIDLRTFTWSELPGIKEDWDFLREPF